MASSLVEPECTVLQKWKLLALVFVLLFAPAVQCTCYPTLIFTGTSDQAELLPVTDMATRQYMAFSIRACSVFLVLSLSNSSTVTGSASRRVSLDYSSNTMALWECKEQSDCWMLKYVWHALTCNQTTDYWLWWSTTQVKVSYPAYLWYPIVEYTWNVELNITHLWKPAISGYFQGYFNVPFPERCCPSNSSKTDSKICTSEQQATSTTAPTTLKSTSALLSTTTSKLQITTEGVSGNKTSNVTAESIVSYTTGQNSTVAADTSLVEIPSSQTADDKGVTTTDTFSASVTDSGTSSDGTGNDNSTTASSSQTIPAASFSEEAPVSTEPGPKSASDWTGDGETSSEPSATVVRTSSSTTQPLKEIFTTKRGSGAAVPGKDVQPLWCACRCPKTSATCRPI